MRTTLKVAELASFLYGFLFFGSFCINAVYYMPFGVDITAYMSMSEILLLFLGQPLLYIPILISLVCLALGDKPWPQVQRSFKAKYDSIAKTDDLAVISLWLIMVLCLCIWYRMSFEVVFMYVMLGAVWLALIPSTTNAMMRSLFWYCRKALARMVVWVRCKTQKQQVPEKSKTRRLKLKFGIRKKNDENQIRRLIMEEKLSPADKRMITLIYANKAVYLIIVMYVFSIFIACAANMMLASALKSGAIEPQKVITVDYDLPENVREGNLIYVGECDKYIFFYHQESEETYVVKRELVTYQTIKNNNRQMINLDSDLGAGMVRNNSH